MLIISLFVLLTDGRPIIFKQIRIGCKGRQFVIYKFRTMKQSKTKDEEKRLTYLGKILRKLSLDELPQLFNVLIKDMSMVGPRPLPQEIEKKSLSLLKSKEEKFYQELQACPK